MAAILSGLPIGSLPDLGDVEQNDNIIAYREDTGKAYRTPISTLPAASMKNISDSFAENLSYSAGDLCIYGSSLYKFTADKTPGEWDESVVEQTTLGKEITAVDIPDIITGYYTDDDDSITLSGAAVSAAKAAYWAHQNLLTNYQSINAVINIMSGSGSVHVIGSRFNNLRGRYLAMERTQDRVVSVRVTSDGASYVSLTMDTAQTIT